MSYIAEYTRPYEGGYKNRPSEETPEMAEFMNKRDDTLLKIEAFLKDLDLSGLGSEYALLSEAGYSFDVSMDDYYVLTISLKNKAGDELSSKSVDLPIESMIIDIDYADGVLTLTLQNGNTVNVSIIDIVRGLVPETRKIAGIDLKDDITAEELKTALDIYDSTVMGGELKPWLYDTSGEEVLVGVYGGKPLYRKFIELNMTITANWIWYDTEISCDEMETVVNGFAIDENGQYYPAYIEKTRSVNKISFAFGAIAENRFIKLLIVEYTKTTDAEGSGNSLTPYGIFNAKLDGIEEDIDEIEAILATVPKLSNGAMTNRIYNAYNLAVSPSKNAYNESPIVSLADNTSNSNARAGIALHNIGVYGVFIYLEPDDGANCIKIIDNEGKKDAFVMNSSIADSIGYKLKRATFTGTTNSGGGMPLDLYGDTHVIVSISVISETDKIAFPVNTGLPGKIFALIADITLKIASEGETYTVEVIYYER